MIERFYKIHDRVTQKMSPRQKRYFNSFLYAGFMLLINMIADHSWLYRTCAFFSYFSIWFALERWKLVSKERAIAGAEARNICLEVISTSLKDLKHPEWIEAYIVELFTYSYKEFKKLRYDPYKWDYSIPDTVMVENVAKQLILNTNPLTEKLVKGYFSNRLSSEWIEETKVKVRGAAVSEKVGII